MTAAIVALVGFLEVTKIASPTMAAAAPVTFALVA
jgi:hypothetical protein